MQEKNKVEVQRLNDQYVDIRDKLPKINVRNLKLSEKVLFWSGKPGKYIQYPDPETLATKTNQELQPIRIGLFGGFAQYSIIA